MKLYLNCNSKAEGSFTKDIYLLRAAKRLGITNVLKYEPTKEPPEYVLNIEPYGPFMTGSIWTGIWEIDLLMSRPLERVNYERANHIFCAINHVPTQIKEHSEKTVLLYQACDPEIHHPYKVEKKYDVVFYGSDEFEVYSERKRIHQLITDKGYKIHLGGKHLPPEEYSKLSCEAKVMFIRSMGQTPDLGEIAQRFFEYYAMGPVLTNWTSDLTNVGVEGVDYCSYHNDIEMLIKLDRLLKEDDFRNYITKNGREIALNYHTYEHRLVTIINYIKEYESRNNRT